MTITPTLDPNIFIETLERTREIDITPLKERRERIQDVLQNTPSDEELIKFAKNYPEFNRELLQEELRRLNEELKKYGN